MDRPGQLGGVGKAQGIAFQGGHRIGPAVAQSHGHRRRNHLVQVESHGRALPQPLSASSSRSRSAALRSFSSIQPSISSG